MKKFLVKILLFALTFVVLDFLAGYCLDFLLKNSPDGRYFKTYYTLNNSEESIVIFGSSRAEANYVPRVFEEVLGKATWNAGRGGQGLPFWYALYLGMKERHVPEIAIINVEADFLREEDNQETFERAGFLRPFYHSNPNIQVIIDKISKYERFLLGSNFYAFNSSYYYLLRPYFFKGIDGRLGDGGWKPLEGKMKSNGSPLEHVETKKAPLNQEMKQMFDAFVADLAERGTVVVVCISPDFGRKVVSSNTIDYLTTMKEIKLINLADSEEFIINPKLYKDKDHLNRYGAELYSKEIAMALRGYVSNEFEYPTNTGSQD